MATKTLLATIHKNGMFIANDKTALQLSFSLEGPRYERYGHQTWVQVNANTADVHAIEPTGDLMQQNSVSATNSVVDIEPRIPFWIMVANFGGKQYQLPKGMITARLGSGESITRILNDSSRVVVHRRIQRHNDGLIADQALGTDDRKFADLCPAPKEPKDRQETCSVDELELDHIDEDIREKVLETLRRYVNMWDGHFGLIEATYHRIKTCSDTHPFRQRPYRAGSKTRQIQVEEIACQLCDGVIRLAQSEWASPIVLDVKSINAIDFLSIIDASTRSPR